MDKKINEQTLEGLGIFEIRNIAREVGVYSPTTIKKHELIEKIMRVIRGEDQPYVKKTKQGRPPKNITTMQDFIEVIVPKKPAQQREKTENFNCSLYNVFNDNQKDINFEELGSNEHCFKGFVKVYGQNEYSLCFLNTIDESRKDLVFINNIQTEFYKLKTGDEISGKYVMIDKEKLFVLKEIYSINQNVVTDNFTRKDDFLNLVAINPNVKLKTNIYSDDDPIFENIDLFCPIAKGQRVLLKTSGGNQLNNAILHRLSTDVNNLKGIMILIDETPENYYDMLSNTNFLVLSNNFSKCSNCDLELEVRLTNLLRQVEEGESVVLYINDITKLQKFYENRLMLDKLSSEESAIIAENYVKDIVLLGKFTQSAGSLTVLAGIDAKNTCSFENLFNNIVSYRYNKFEYELNQDSCRTLNIEKILSKSELNKLKSKFQQK
ncbi:MAG: hypothetical protein ACI4TI_02070 [Christensenellales bacterium]